MNNDLQQTIIETKREDLIEILRQEKMSVWEAAEFALQEYVMGVPNNEYNYHNYHEHFTKRYLKDDEGDYKFGTAMTSVMQHLFHQHISKAYSTIKNAVYEYMDAQDKAPAEDRIDLKTFDYNLSEMADYVVYYKMELIKEIVDVNWNIISKTKAITKPNKKK